MIAWDEITKPLKAVGEEASEMELLALSGLLEAWAAFYFERATLLRSADFTAIGEEAEKRKPAV